MRWHGLGRACMLVGVIVFAIFGGGQYARADQPSPRYFPKTGYSIANDTIWDYFNHRGGVATFGYPASRAFTFQGYTVQFFQRLIVQLDKSGQPRLLNLLDPGLMPYTRFNHATFPGVDSGLIASAPSPSDQAATLAFVKAVAPDSFGGMPVNFHQTFISTVPLAIAFPTGGDANLLPGFDLEMWGIPTSLPADDPANHDFVYQRFQRGIMHYQVGCNCTQAVLLADYFKSILTGNDLPADLAQEAQESPFFKQVDPSQPNWVHNPSLLPNTDFTSAFTPEPNCSVQPSTSLGQAFGGNLGIADKLGCAKAGEAPVQLAWQPFQRGSMLWRTDTLTIFALLTGGTSSSFVDTYINGQPLPVIVPPSGLLVPQRGFGLIWQQGPGLRDKLGWATQVEHGLSGGAQDFTNGTAIWTTWDNYTNNASNNVFILYSDGTCWSGSFGGSNPLQPLQLGCS